MKETLSNNVAELQSKYIELPEFKRHCTVDIDKVLPLINIAKIAAKKSSHPSTAATLSQSDQRKEDRS